MALTGSVCIVLCIIQHVAPLDPQPAEQFQKNIKTFINDYLKAQKFQEYIDKKVNYHSVDISGSRLIKLISDTLSSKFLARIKVVQKLRDVVEANWGNFSTYNMYENCCHGLQNVEIDPSFRTKVNRNTMCTHGEGLYQKPGKFANSALLDAMRENLQNVPSIKYQFLGTEEGVATVYPKSKICSSSYDPRFRPWYVETVAPKEKDVVIVIDRSGSMVNTHQGQTLINIAKEAARTTVATLNPNDRVGIVTFSSKASTPPGSSSSTCYSTILAQATPKNKQYLENYIDKLSAGGSTYYAKAFHKAFGLFANSENFYNNTRDKVVLFLTDGESTDPREQVLNTIRNGNSALNNSVIILTYGLGDRPNSEFLTEIAEQTMHDPSAGEIVEGIFTSLLDPAQLRENMGSYYNFLSKTGHKPDAIFSVPYYDAFGLGMLTTVSLPVFHNGDLKGVVGVDMTLSDLLKEVTYFQEGEQSYSFVTNRKGRLLTHPLLARPMAVKEDPIFLQITTVERSLEARDVLSGKPGNATVSSMRVISRGDTLHEGINSYNINSKYFWHPVEGTEFIVCVVVGEGDRQAQMSWQGHIPQQFLYHRLDIRPPYYVCNYFGRPASKGETSIKFSGAAFKDPNSYYDNEETAETLDRYEMYLTGFTSKNPGFRDQVFETVALTSLYFENSLTEGFMYIYKTAVWLYVGMASGVFRLYPGIQMDKYYDHSQRPWYKRALAQKSGIAFSTPYLDAFGAGIVITLSKSVYEGRSNGVHANDDFIIGVTGMDFTMQYFYNLILKSFGLESHSSTQLHKFVVMDTSGYIVVHHDWISNTASMKASGVEKVHITTKEPAIAKDLIDASIMEKERCTNYEDIIEQHYWRVSMGSSTRESTHYNMYMIQDINVFVIDKKTAMLTTPFGTVDMLVDAYGHHEECYS